LSVSRSKELRLRKSRRLSRIIKKERRILFLSMLRRNLEEVISHISRPSREDSRLRSWKRKSSIWIQLKILLLSATKSHLTVKMKNKKNRLLLSLSLPLSNRSNK
jgi:hypothetical protein